MYDSASWQSLQAQARPLHGSVGLEQEREPARTKSLAYMNRAHAAGQQVLVCSRRAVVVTQRQAVLEVEGLPRRRALPRTGQSFRLFDNAFPWVRTYSAWNEVNHVSQPTYRKPALAARYYDVLRRNARARKFKVMAADVLDTSNLGSYLRRVHARAPRATRACGACTTTRTSTTRRPATRARMLAHGPGRGLADRDGRHRPLRRLAAAQVQPAAGRRPHQVHVQARRPVRRKRAGLRSKITQLFVYTWFGEARGTRFDAGLVNPNGSPRTALAIVRKNARTHR